jgi:hypothetical protein
MPPRSRCVALTQASRSASLGVTLREWPGAAPSMSSCNRKRTWKGMLYMSLLPRAGSIGNQVTDLGTESLLLCITRMRSNFPVFLGVGGLTAFVRSSTSEDRMLPPVLHPLIGSIVITAPLGNSCNLFCHGRQFHVGEDIVPRP